MPNASASLSGRCYCGATTLSFDADPISVAVCHCVDCRRWTGAAAPAFAAFEAHAVTLDPPDEAPYSGVPGVNRWRCQTCGSPMMAQFAYLPDQVYVPLGVIEGADALEPSIHCHVGSKLRWVEVPQTILQHQASARDDLNAARRDTP